MLKLTCNITGWAEVQRGVYIDADLETSTLEIKTDSSPGSDETVEVNLYNSDGDYAGAVILDFTSPSQYQLRWCTLSRTNFPTALPTESDKVWTISLTKTSGIRLVIHCNEAEVLNVLMSDTTCSYGSWNYHWSIDVQKIRFRSIDTASDYYRLRGKSRYVENKSVEL